MRTMILLCALAVGGLACNTTNPKPATPVAPSGETVPGTDKSPANTPPESPPTPTPTTPPPTP